MAQAKSPKPKSDEPGSKPKQLKHAKLTAEAVPAEGAPAVKLEVEPVDRPTAKAGKRSTKAKQAAEAKQAKEARKADSSSKPSKSTAKPPRSRLERAGKRYAAASQLVDKSKSYPLAEALDLAIKTANTKFDASIEMHLNLGVDPKQADQNVRDIVILPAGTGKTTRVAVIASEPEAEKLFAKLDKGDIDFDVLIATPEMMPRLGKYAKLLGPKGLMPNPKSGTVTTETAKAEKEAKAGKVEYRVDQAGIVHLSIGKASFGASKLTDNAEAVLKSVRAAKPASLKGIYLKSAYIAATMGPSIRLEI